MNSGKILLGALAGFAAGALTGILFAPDKGSETRKKIKNKGEDYVDGVKEKFDEILHAISEKFERGHKAEEVIDEAAKGPQAKN